jgi:hypothetical protein
VKFNRTGYWLLALFGIGGLIFLSIGLLVPSAGFVMVPLGAAWVLSVIGLVAYALHQSRKAKHELWLFQNGLTGRATVVDASSNVEVNGEPVMKLVLDLDVPGAEARRVERKVLMSKFAGHRMKPGVVLPVHLNPRDPQDLLVRW